MPDIFPSGRHTDRTDATHVYPNRTSSKHRISCGPIMMSPPTTSSQSGPPVSNLMDVDEVSPHRNFPGSFVLEGKSPDIVQPLKFTPGRKLVKNRMSATSTSILEFDSDGLDSTDCFTPIVPKVARRRRSSPKTDANSNVVDDGVKKRKRGSGLGMGKLLCYFVLLPVLTLFISVVILAALNDGQCLVRPSLNVTALSRDLDHQLYGQHLAVNTIPAVLEEFITGDHINVTTLVIAFNGFTGIGKTFASNIIGRQFNHHNVHTIIMPLHYPQTVSPSSVPINEMILAKVKPCQLNLFVLDEMDKAPSAVVSGLQSAVDTLTTNSTFNTTKSVIILVSNNAGADISDYVYDALESHRSREDITLAEVQNLLYTDCADRADTMLWHCELRGLVDHVVPFLPLERTHVKQCIRADASGKGYELNELEVDEVADELKYFPPRSPLFSTTGCRTVTAKVDLQVVS